MAFLMCKDKVVYETLSGRVVAKELLPFCGSYESWRKKRTYAISNIDARNEDLCLPDNAVEKRRKLSLSDCYWIKHNSDRDATNFAAITPYRNRFTTFAMTNRSSASPDLVVGGSMCKHWERTTNGLTVLCKSGKREWVEAEHVALETARSLGLPVGDHSLRKAEYGSLEILLSNLSDESSMLLTLGGYGEKCNGYSPKSVAEAYARLGVAYDKALDYALQPILFDAVVGNYDRKSNMGNWGFYKNSTTGAVSLAPIFDFNLCHPNQEHLFMSDVARHISADGLASGALLILEKWRQVVLLPVWRVNVANLIDRLKEVRV